jgi:hypothetical protein
MERYWDWCHKIYDPKYQKNLTTQFDLQEMLPKYVQMHDSRNLSEKFLQANIEN